jgi:hypothetical protein
VGKAIKEQYDGGFKALKSVGEKMKAVQNFVAKKLRDFVETERVRKKPAKLNFQTMLREVDFIAHNTKRVLWSSLGALLALTYADAC